MDRASGAPVSVKLAVVVAGHEAEQEEEEKKGE